jgi:hypothetical protein
VHEKLTFTVVTRSAGVWTEEDTAKLHRAGANGYSINSKQPERMLLWGTFEHEQLEAILEHSNFTLETVPEDEAVQRNLKEPIAS